MLYHENKELNKDIIKHKSQYEMNENDMKKIKEIIKENHDKLSKFNIFES